MQSNLQDKLAVESLLRTELKIAITELAAAEYERCLGDFLRNLNEFNRKVYALCLEKPYSEKDWPRNAHDIYVTSAMQMIVSEENEISALSGGNIIPSWLVTAALVHDRGYAMLAEDEEKMDEYLARSGAHWEHRESRILHALLSRRFAEEHILDREPMSHESKGWIADPELFLEVIEKHDYPLIGLYEELPVPGRHHFDADSSFSLSVLSFLKDFLSYHDEPDKLERFKTEGIAFFRPQDLFDIRAARYFPRQEDLPGYLSEKGVKLKPELLKFSETGGCIPAHSRTAKKIFHNSFEDLFQCLQELSEAKSIEEFTPFLSDLISSQFDRLLSR